MRGLSQSGMRFRDGAACFSGSVSLENYGGFASIRVQVSDTDLAGFDGLLIRLKGDGKTYKFRLRTNARFDGIGYSADFTTQAGQRQSHRISKAEFVPMYRGRIVTGTPPLDMASVLQWGFLISDKQEGMFELNEPPWGFRRPINLSQATMPDLFSVNCWQSCCSSSTGGIFPIGSSS